jgi:hypothetical protein
MINLNFPRVTLDFVKVKGNCIYCKFYECFGIKVLTIVVAKMSVGRTRCDLSQISGSRRQKYRKYVKYHNNGARETS